MSAIFKQRGDSVNYVPDADVSAGDVIIQGDLVGVAKLDINAGDLGALALTGVYSFPKATGASTAIAAGTKLYWDGTQATADANDGETEPTAYPYIGKSIASATDDDAAVETRLCP
jgi:predicted RecA/RadA family phage recombinase